MDYQDMDVVFVLIISKENCNNSDIQKFIKRIGLRTASLILFKPNE